MTSFRIITEVFSFCCLGFLLELQKNPKDGSKMSDAPSLLTLSSPIHLVLIKTDLSGNQTLLSSHYLEWRKILSSASGRFSLTLEMNGIGTESKVPVGVLEVKAEIVPKLPQVCFSSNDLRCIVLQNLFQCENFC